MAAAPPPVNTHKLFSAAGKLKIFTFTSLARQGRAGQHQVRGLRDPGLAQRVLLLPPVQGLHGGQGIHPGQFSSNPGFGVRIVIPGRREHHLPRVCPQQHGPGGGPGVKWQQHI